MVLGSKGKMASWTAVLLGLLGAVLLLLLLAAALPASELGAGRRQVRSSVASPSPGTLYLCEELTCQCEGYRYESGVPTLDPFAPIEQVCTWGVSAPERTVCVPPNSYFGPDFLACDDLCRSTSRSNCQELPQLVSGYPSDGSIDRQPCKPVGSC